MGLIELFGKKTSPTQEAAPEPEPEPEPVPNKKYTLSEHDRSLSKEWDRTYKKQMPVFDCRIDATISGVSYTEMREISAELRGILRNHGFDVPEEVS